VSDLLAIERAFVGCLIRSPETVWAVEAVKPVMLTSPVCRDIYKAIIDLAEKGRRVSLTTLAAHPGIQPEYPDEGGPKAAILAVLRANAEDAGSAQDYADSILDAFGRRRIADMAVSARNAAQDPSKSISDIIADIETVLLSTVFDGVSSHITRLGDAVRTSLDRTAENFRCKGEVQIGVTTGILELDRLIGPMMGGDLVTIAARSGEGKTTLALQMLRHAASGPNGKPALLISQEMTATQIAMRTLSSWTQIPVRKQRAGDIDMFGFDSLREAADEAQGVRLYIDDCGQQRTSAICSKIRSFHRQHGLGCVAIDHILLVRPENPRWTKVETVEYAAMAFKELAKELDIPIILLAQLTRGSQGNANTWRFTDQALYGGDAIKQASDVMLGVTLPRKWMKQREPEESDHRAHDEWAGKMEKWRDQAEIGALKMRDDDDGQWLQLGFNGRTYTFGTKAPVYDEPSLEAM